MWNGQEGGSYSSLSAAGGGAIGTGAAAARGFGTAGFFAATGAERVRGADCAAVTGGTAGRCAAPVAGSGVMILTGGIDAEVGNSALVGLPDGAEPSIPGNPADAAATAGTFQDGALREISPS